MNDLFTKPVPFQADVAVGTDDVIERVFDMLDCHVSKMYEWLPFNRGVLDQVPQDPRGRRKWLPGQSIDRFPFFD